MIISYVLFFLAGLGFGYALAGWTAWIPLFFPILLALIAIQSDGLSGDIVMRLIAALVITAIGVVAGRLLADRGARETAGAG